MLSSLRLLSLDFTGTLASIVPSPGYHYRLALLCTVSPEFDEGATLNAAQLEELARTHHVPSADSFDRSLFEQMRRCSATFPNFASPFSSSWRTVAASSPHAHSPSQPQPSQQYSEGRSSPRNSHEWWGLVFRETVRHCHSRNGFPLSSSSSSSSSSGDDDAWLDRAFAQCWESFATERCWRLFGEVRHTLAELKRLQPHLRIAVASNFDQRLHRLLNSLQLDAYIDLALDSYSAGVAKPHADFFVEHLCRAAEVSPHETLHVGDHLSKDVEGALGAGLQAIHLDRSGGSNSSPGSISSLSELLFL